MPLQEDLPLLENAKCGLRRKRKLASGTEEVSSNCIVLPKKLNTIMYFELTFVKI